MNGWKKRTAIGFAFAHTLLLAAYTMPAQVVPVRMRYWSQAYARVLFHQDWRLFAPDPPACGCAIEIVDAIDGPAMRLDDLHRGFIWKRMTANACRYAEAAYDPDRRLIILPDVLQRSLVNMTGRDPRSDGSALRVHRVCEGRDEFVEVHFSKPPR